MTLDEKRARKICNEASPGPWTVDPRQYRDDGTQKYFPSLRFVSEEAALGTSGALTINESKSQTMKEINATADFIAESRTMLPEALGTIADLRTMLLYACNLAREAMDAYSPGRDPRNEYDRRLKHLLAVTITDEQIEDLMTRPSCTQELQALCQTALWPAIAASEPDRTLARGRLAKIIYPRTLGPALSW